MDSGIVGYTGHVVLPLTWVEIFNTIHLHKINVIYTAVDFMLENQSFIFLALVNV